MVQQFHVLRCFSCRSFQVQQVKKSSRWRCSLCGEKQSLLKEFGRGSAADCRRHVQKLNAMRGAMLEQQEQMSWSLWEEEEEEEGAESTAAESRAETAEPPASRWTKYLQGEEPGAEPDQEALMNREQIHRKRKRREEEERWTPAQTNCCSLREKPVGGRPAPTNTSTMENLNTMENISTTMTSNRSSPPRRLSSACSGLVAPVSGSRWSRFFNAAYQEEGEGLSGRNRDCGRSFLVGRDDSPTGVGQCGSDEVRKATGPTCHEAISMWAPPTEKPRPFLPAGSLFDSGEDFNFDDMF